MERITGILNSIKPIQLKTMNSVKFLNRFDTKYRLPVDKLCNVLDNIKNQYYVLEINSKRIQGYKTLYYDTPGNYFYNLHHNGKLGRIKIRKREYTDSGICFIEIKKKNNKKKTEKIRTQVDELQPGLAPCEISFINENIHNGFNAGSLELKSSNMFRRITLVNKNFTERCTIDLDIKFTSNMLEHSVSDMAIVELKKATVNLKTPFSVELKKNRVYSNGFSKYCIGRAVLNSSLKNNLFKMKVLDLYNNYNGLTSISQNHEIIHMIK